MRAGVMGFCRQRYRALLDQRGIVDIDFVLGELRPDAGVERYPIGTTCARSGCRHGDTPQAATDRSSIRYQGRRVQDPEPSKPDETSTAVALNLCYAGDDVRELGGRRDGTAGQQLKEPCSCRGR